MCKWKLGGPRGSNPAPFAKPIPKGCATRSVSALKGAPPAKIASLPLRVLHSRSLRCFYLCNKGPQFLFLFCESCYHIRRRCDSFSLSIFKARSALFLKLFPCLS